MYYANIVVIVGLFKVHSLFIKIRLWASVLYTRACDIFNCFTLPYHHRCALKCVKGQKLSKNCFNIINHNYRLRWSYILCVDFNGSNFTAYSFVLFERTCRVWSTFKWFLHRDQYSWSYLFICLFYQNLLVTNERLEECECVGDIRTNMIQSIMMSYEKNIE